MWCDRVLGNLGDVDQPDALSPAVRGRLDLVDLHWHECGRRALRKTSRAGRTVRILLPLGAILAHGDVLAETADAVVAVRLVPADVLVVRPGSLQAMAAVALEIGNLHAPAQVAGDELWVLPDGPVEEILGRLGVGYERGRRRFLPAPASGLPAVTLAADFDVRS